MAGGLLIQRKAGVTVPESFIERAVKRNPRCMGTALASKGVMQINHLRSEISMDTLKAALAVNPEGQLFVHLGYYPTTFDANDVQPFVLMCEDDDLDKPLMCVMMEGEFVSSNTESSHLDAWHVKEYLIDKCNTYYDMCGQDIDKTLVALRSKSALEEIDLKFKSSGSMLFLAADGQPWVRTKDAKYARDTEFGWVSNVLDWKPETVAKDNASERAEPAKRSFSASRGSAPIIAQSPPSDNPKDFPNDPEVPYSLVPETFWNQSNGKAILKYIRQKSWDGKLPPEAEMTAKGQAIDKDNIKKFCKREEIKIISKERHEWEERQKKKPAVVEKELTAKERIALKRAEEQKPPEPEKQLTARERIALKRAEEQKPSAEAPKPEPKPEPSREFNSVSSAADRSAIETILLDVMENKGKERKIKPPVELKELRSMTFSMRFGVPDALSLGLENGDLYVIATEHPLDAYLLLKEALAELERLAPSRVTKEPPSAKVA